MHPGIASRSGRGKCERVDGRMKRRLAQGWTQGLFSERPEGLERELLEHYAWGGVC